MKIEVSKHISMVDEDIIIKIVDIKANSRIKVQAEMIDEFGIEWRSEAVYNSGDNKEIDLSRDESIGGSYKGVDPMGLFWSMVDESKDKYYCIMRAIQQEYKIKATCDGETEEIKIRRDFIKEGVRYEYINQGMVQGELITHDNAKGTIVIFGGSDGSNNRERAIVLSSHGYNVFACYFFGRGTLPKTLANVPIEFFSEVLKMLELKGVLENQELTVIGSSRGAELALILATRYREISRVILISGSCYSFIGVSKPSPLSAWSIDRKMVPFLSFSTLGPIVKMLYLSLKKMITKKPISMVAAYNKIVNINKIHEAERIKGERFKGEVVMITGGDDKLWPSYEMSRIVQKFRDIPELKGKTVLYNFEEAGHVFTIPHLPSAPLSAWGMCFGGSRKKNAEAAYYAHKKILESLEGTQR